MIQPPFPFLICFAHKVSVTKMAGVGIEEQPVNTPQPNHSSSSACRRTPPHPPHSDEREMPTPTRRGLNALTWPKKRNGSRKVKPLHIHDWKPSARKARSVKHRARQEAEGDPLLGCWVTCRKLPFSHPQSPKHSSVFQAKVLQCLHQSSCPFLHLFLAPQDMGPEHLQTAQSSSLELTAPQWDKGHWLEREIVDMFREDYSITGYWLPLGSLATCLQTLQQWDLAFSLH